MLYNHVPITYQLLRLYLGLIIATIISISSGFPSTIIPKSYSKANHSWKLHTTITKLNLSSNNDDGVGFSSSEQQQDDELLEYSIDSFLRGEYDRQFADDAPAPHPGLTPGSTVEAALRCLRQIDHPEPAHGAAVLMRFCVPLSRGERWGDSKDAAKDNWKQVLRGAITPAMLAQRLRASDDFSGLLDWKKLDVTEGTYSLDRGFGDSTNIGGPRVAFVNAALFFGDGIEPSMIQFTLRRIGGVWLIDTARLSTKNLFVDNKEDDSSSF